ncbi:MAG: hypothetical protein WBF66_07310 [Dehalococcoidia bacterium]
MRVKASELVLPERGPLSPDKKFGEEVCHEKFLRGEHWAYHAKCWQCTVEFSVRSWWDGLDPEDWCCPLCKGRVFLIRQEHVNKFIFEVTRGEMSNHDDRAAHRT